MEDKNKTLCFSGHRTGKMPICKDDVGKLKQNLYSEIDNAIVEGYEIFLFGACYGFDLICAEMVLMRKKIVKPLDTKKIKLIAVVPFEEQATKWIEYDRIKYFNILSKCDDVLTLNKHFKVGCYYARNRYMVDHSSKLICYYNGSGGGTGYTVDYAEKHSVQIINLCTMEINDVDRHH